MSAAIVRASKIEAKRRGWTEVDPDRGYWARGSYRIQRSSRVWRWWYVVRLSKDAPRGREGTLLGALDAVDRAAQQSVPPSPRASE